MRSTPRKKLGKDEDYRIMKKPINKIGNIMGIITAIILLVFFTAVCCSLLLGSSEAEPSIKKPAPKIQIQNINNTASTIDQQYSLTIIVEKSSYDMQDVKGYLNDTPIAVLQDFQAGKNHYKTQLGLKPGDNIFKINVYANDIGQQSSEVTSKQVTIRLTATEKPTLNIHEAVQEGANWVVKDYQKDTFELEVDTAPENSKNSGATSLHLNDEVLKPTDYTKYKHELKSLKDGTNTFVITAENEQGTITSTLTINKLSSAEQQARAAIENVLSEAEVTCQQYAEKLLLVKDINIHYDQSSIRRQQPDGNLLIKVNIADSQGFWRQEKPLGIMECTTNPTGMLVLNFERY